jgi:HD-GYP domain-containing protein (c-di-GMP phosphodiesterase class II)
MLVLRIVARPAQIPTTTVARVSAESALEQVRTAEVIGSLCLATDLGMGFPFEHGLESTLITMRLCEALGVDDVTAFRTYYACLLMYAGCTIDGERKADIFPGGLTEHNQHRQFGSMRENIAGVAGALSPSGVSAGQRVVKVTTGLPRALRFIPSHFAALCEVAGLLAARFGLPESIHDMFPMLTERWDGSSVLRRARGEEIPLPIRIIHVGRDAAYQRLLGDDDHVVGVVQARAGRAFDPDVATVFVDDAARILGPPTSPASVWDDVLAAEPQPWRMLIDSDIDMALSAIGLFSDLSSPYFTGHCAAVAELAGSAGELHGFEPEVVESIRRAAHVHDVGRAAVTPTVWSKAGPLNADEREQVRLHPYHTERVLARSSFLSDLAPIASAHHERLDGSGYHRGLDATHLSGAARLLAVADALQSKTEPRPYRPAMSAEEATAVLLEKAGEGIYDPTMVAAVAEAAGQPPPPIQRPAGLTEREAQVIGLLARGLQTKQIARELDIAKRTADRHIQNSYRKMGVSTRAAATIFASEHGLVSK